MCNLYNKYNTILTVSPLKYDTKSAWVLRVKTHEPRKQEPRIKKQVTYYYLNVLTPGFDSFPGLKFK